VADVTKLGPWVRRFLEEHLVTERNLSRNTQRSYRDTLALLIPFAARAAQKKVDALTDGIVYERLAWAINVVTVCPRHRFPLANRCRGCTRQQPALAVYSRPGRCSHCGHWLGTLDAEAAGDGACGSSRNSEYELYASNAVGELLGAGATAGRLSLARFRTNLRMCANRLTDGKANALGERTGVSKSAVQSWITTRMRARLDVLLRMCACVGVPLASILTARRLAGVDWAAVDTRCPRVDRGVKRHRTSDEVRSELEAALRREIPCSIRELAESLGFQRPERLYQVSGALCHQITLRYRNCTRTHWWKAPGAKRISDLKTMRGLLEGSLAMDPPIPVRRVAVDLGYANAGYIHRKFPELCHAIAQKSADQRLRELETVRCALLTACAEQPPPTLYELSKRLGFRNCSAVQSRFPELADRLKAARVANKHEKDAHRLRTELLFVIYGNKAPALSSVSRRFNVSRSSLMDRWPDLCRAISAGYLRARRELKIQRQESLNENARRFARELHKQGLRPTHARIRKLLPADSIKDWAMLHRAVKRAQRFLGMRGN
jgi:transcriptional regulator with XRE-family HTH domain